MTDVPIKTGGGAAAVGGFDYQNRVAAWLAVNILAESSVTPNWDLTEPDCTLEFIRCETEQPVDDILIRTSKKGSLFFQVRKTLSLSANRTSRFADTVTQFVRQFLCRRDHSGKTKQEWDRPLDAARDRLILTTSGQSSAKIRVSLAAVLNRIRKLGSQGPIESVALNNKEKHVLSVVTEHIKAAWEENSSGKPSESDLKACLVLMHVQTLDLDDGAANRNEAGNVMRTSVLVDPQQENAAWAKLIAYGLCTRAGPDAAPS